MAAVCRALEVKSCPLLGSHACCEALYYMRGIHNQLIGITIPEHSSGKRYSQPRFNRYFRTSALPATKNRPSVPNYAVPSQAGEFTPKHNAASKKSQDPTKASSLRRTGHLDRNALPCERTPPTGRPGTTRRKPRSTFEKRDAVLEKTTPNNSTLASTTTTIRRPIMEARYHLPRAIQRTLQRKRTQKPCDAQDPERRGRKVRHSVEVARRWGYVRKISLCDQPLRAFQAPAVPTIHDPLVIRRPGEVVDIPTVVRNYWAFPLVGFNSILEVPVYPFEVLEGDYPRRLETMDLPSEIFGVPLRSDILFRAWRFYIKAYTGWTERMMLFKWEWTGSRKKARPQNCGKARMGWRRAPHRWPGVHTKPTYRPRDHRKRLNQKILFLAWKHILSAKFAQDQLRVVQHFNLSSHKTKHCTVHLRRLLGTKAQRVLLVHCDGKGDLNNNFRLACAKITGVQRQLPHTLSVYDMIKSNQVIFSKIALETLIRYIETYPKKKRWLPRYATPNGKPAPKPAKVPGWDAAWKLQKQQEALMDYKEVFNKMKKHWTWSTDIKGPMKLWKDDPLKGFRLKEWTFNEPASPWKKWELLNVEYGLTDDGTLKSSEPPIEVSKVPVKPNYTTPLDTVCDTIWDSSSTEASKVITREDVVRLRLRNRRLLDS